MAEKKATKEEIDNEELARMSGESEVRQVRYVVPVLKFNGSTNAWTKLTQDKDNQFNSEELEAAPEVVFLKLRRTLQSYEKAEGGGIRTYSNEHNSRSDHLTLFERRPGTQKAKMIDQGSVDELRNRYPNLRLKQNVYVLYNDDVLKVGIRGKSLGSLFEYLQSFEKGEHMHQFITKLDSHEETNEGGLTYYVMDFVKGKPSDLTKVAEKIREVHKNLETQDKNFVNSSRTEEEKAKEVADAIHQDANPTLDTIDEATGEVIDKPKASPPTSKDDGEIDPKEIPF